MPAYNIDYNIRDARKVGRCTEGKYRGELCLKPPANYPITKNHKLSPGRIRNVNVRATQFGAPGVIKKNIPYLKKKGIDSKFIKKKSND